MVACITQDQSFVASARQELDAVVGRPSLPVPDDKPNQPYVSAIVEEIFSWRSAGPEGLPHLNKEETAHNGYWIPQCSIIVPNFWTISQQEALFGPNLVISYQIAGSRKIARRSRPCPLPSLATGGGPASGGILRAMLSGLLSPGSWVCQVIARDRDTYSKDYAAGTKLVGIC